VETSEKEKNKLIKLIVFAGFFVLLIFILWSVVTETLLPLYNSCRYSELIYNAIGIPIILLGTGIFVYGGWVFVRDTHNLFDNNIQLSQNLDTIRDKTVSKEKRKTARSENTKFLFVTWKKGGLGLLTGALLIIAGGIIINFKKIIE
jgi:hypothetical protein